MFTSLICGSFHERESEEDDGNSPRSIKKTWAKTHSFVRRRSNDKAGYGKNPYSTVGLDKFSALLSDLEEKKKNIYLQRDSRDIMFVRFVYLDSEEVVPVIVKSKEKTQRQRVEARKTGGLRSGNEANKQPGAAAEQAKVTGANDMNIAIGQKRVMTWEMNMKKLGRPSYYIPMFMVLVLLLLAIFGRSFAILCASIGWYLVPTLTGMPDEQTTTSSSSVGSMKKKKKTTEATSRATSPNSK